MREKSSVLDNITKYYIYKITNLINHKIYIGKTKHKNKRWRKHISLSKDHDEKRKKFYLHKAIKKYGVKNFSYEIIDWFYNENICLKMETVYIKKFNSKNPNFGYNLTYGGEGSSGYVHTQEAIKKISEHAKTRTGKNNPFYGKKHSKETLNRINQTKLRTGNWGKKKYLNNKQIEEIRIKYQTGLHSYSKLSKEYNVSTSVIAKIIKFERSYKNDIKPENYLIPDKILKRVTVEKANEIRIKYGAGTLVKNLSVEYKISIRTISSLINFHGAYKND